MELILRLIGRASQSRDGRPASGRGRSALRPAFLPTFLKDQRGVVAIYVAFLLSVLMGVLVIVFDVGRLTIVRSQAQNAADSAAIAAAVQLDGGDSARDRAEAVARGAANQMSNFQTTSGSPDIQIDTVVFYQDEDKLAATSDANAAFVEVTVQPRPVELMFEPVVAALAGTTSEGFTNIGATAMAGNAPGVCDPPALLICNPNEVGLKDITEADAAGRQVLLRQAGNAPAPGDFGLMCPPPYDNCGAPIIEDFLASQGVDKCSVRAISTKPGVNFNKVNNGMNHRFEDGSLPYPMAPNIVEYPRDDVIEYDMLGDGNWDRDGYWEEQHGGVGYPAGYETMTRYQIYLYELGESFAANTYTGETIYPIPDSGVLPEGFSVVTSVGLYLPLDGEPASIPMNDPRRRVMPAAVVQCQAIGVRGNFDIDTRDMKIVDIFITEAVGPPPANKSPIVVEIVRMRSTTTYDSLIANVWLVD